MENRPESMQRQSGRRVLLALAVLFAAPFATGALLYGSGWRPAENSAHGELLRPPLPVGSVDLGEEEGARITLDGVDGKWTLVYFGGAQCSADCMRSLYNMRQVQVAQGREQQRVQRIFVAGGDLSATAAAALQRVFPGLRVIAAAHVPPPAWPDRSPDGRTYLVDPMGNLMMRYGRDADPGGMRKDLARLLAYSWVG